MHLEDLIRPAVIHSGEGVAYANQEFCTLIGADTPAELIGEPLDLFTQS
jgi:hypothetical protein